MCVFDTFWSRCCTASIGQSNHIVFAGGLNFKAGPTSVSCGLVELQALQNGFVEGPAQLAFCGISVDVDDERHVGLGTPVSIKERKVLDVDNDHVGFGVLEDVGDVILLQAIVDSCEFALAASKASCSGKGRTNAHCASSSNAIHGFKESWRIGCENSHSLEAILLDVVANASRAICELFVASSQDLSVCGFVVNRYRLWSLSGSEQPRDETNDKD
jgi:hypothetical protein